ncbi:hypothetical protein [Treponema sp.]|uniref:hypothetical protein n=1 Tax=Treponema sp. TaxID=166 RepID=UPI00298D61E2|nr:hypothetical protein [Treponema sp.]MCQ2242459.1 hypothetical protein [Treponema sp.]
MSYNLRNKETGELIPIAGNGVGVAKFGSPIQDWLKGHSSAATAITADKDGILYYVNFNADTATPLVATLVVNGKSIRGTRTTGWSSAITLPIRKGDIVYVVDPLTGDQSTFYPFAENIVQPIEGGEVFSSQEVCIGTIDVDGVEKKVYRKSFTKSMSANGTWQAEIGATLASVVNFYGTFKKDSANWSQHIPYYHTDGAGSYSIYCYVNENGNVQCTGYSTTDGQYFKGKYLLHVEYTKVND